MKRNWRRGFGARAAAALVLLVAAMPAWADFGLLNMTEGVTESSRQIYDLHMRIFWITVVIGLVVFGAMFYSMFRHRKSRGVKPAQFHHSTAVEIVWTVIPLIILVSMAVPATRVLIDLEDTSDAEMTVKVTGYQWFWGYEYMGEDVQFFSRLDEASNRARQLGSGIDPSSVDNYLQNVDRRLVLPVDTKIRFLITAEDVIHSWWVPDLGWKKDAIPGFVNQTWTVIDEPGVYRGRCAELCGRDHGFMPVVVEAVAQDEYEQWLAGQRGDDGEAARTAAVDGDDAGARLAAR
ncbi:cytochrome c oxidase subunit II [Sediminicurvatus halobius]|uniref:Cytochrome c oxidase subunit 2 n=1 Tax=Sediminicurvatus halobius TaxID=2182432 RepID=A0A2U2MYR3_9GAMM|nr:cytochrome c oxidase subunit II [Spiribacter halobius]PWG61948.1 cytochrome c oxidase subunit II [Spiribacter halobius]UEX78356.1 cytochrome c oxidase subunit II [Spiribacter halobius]